MPVAQQIQKPERVKVAALWAVEDVAKFLQVSTRTVWRMVKQGTLPPSAVVRFSTATIRFDPEKIQTWAKQRQDPAFLRLRDATLLVK